MQPSEIWRRGVVLPHTVDVAQRIKDWDVDESIAVDYLPITNEAMFYRLWDIGLFTAINKMCGTLIEDYEAEWLQPEHFPNAATVVTKHLKRNANGEIGDFLEQLLALISRAKESNVPLYFEC